MFRCFHGRAGHYALLILVSAGLYLINLGGPSLWDIDEGNNAEAAREMLARRDFVIPYFNYQLRVDKPALLYWLQAAAYQVCGVNEFAARLPSALAAAAAVLVTYELGCLLCGALAGLWAGLILASTVLFTAAAHFANPDALLSAFTSFTLLACWRGLAAPCRGWFLAAGVSSGLAFLAKGPVGLVLPLGVVGTFLLWTRQLGRLWDRRVVLATLAFLVVAMPWYTWVGVETRGEFLRGFFLTHNRDRFLSPMENHSGPIFFYVLVLMAGFVPWSVFFGPAAWYGVKALWEPKKLFQQSFSQPEAPAQERLSQPEAPARSYLAGASGWDVTQYPQPDRAEAFRFLWSWIGVYFVFFSLSGTKLPNYILPLYAPTAVLLADFLERWRRGVVQPSAWVIPTSLACLAFLGLGFLVGLLLAGGVLPWPLVQRHILPGLAQGAGLGLLPLAGAGFACWSLRRQRRGEMLIIVALTAVLFTGTLAAWAGSALNASKAPRELAGAIQEARRERDIRIGCFQYFQPSLVFYARREVVQLPTAEQAIDFLRCPLEVYLVLPEALWDALEDKAPPECRILGRQHDLYRNCALIVVGNR